MKLVHAADIHLDSPLRGLERYDGAPVDEIRGASRRALENLVELCRVEAADLLLIAGDVYDGDWRDYNTGLFFAAKMAELAREGVRVVVLRGNHDAASRITRHLRLPEGVEELATRAPETRVLEELGVAVHGQGYSRRDVTDDLARAYPDPVPGLFNVGLLHTALEGREGHDRYAPCSVDALRSKGYDYWALGHVHRREVVCEDPWIVFPGNLQGRHVQEAGPKGVTLVRVEDGVVRSVEPRELDAVRWTVCEVGADGARSAHDVVDLARESLARAVEEAGERTLAARVVVTGTSAAHGELSADPERWLHEVRAASLDLAAPVFVERVVLRTRTAIDLDALRRHDDPVGALLRSLDDLRGDEAGLEALVEELRDLEAKLPAEYRGHPDALDLRDPRAVAFLLDDVEQMLVPRLLDGREAT